MICGMPPCPYGSTPGPAAPAQIAQRAGHSVTTLLAVYAHCIDGQDDITNRQIERALLTQNQARHLAVSGSANRRYRLIPVRHMSVRGPHLGSADNWVFWDALAVNRQVSVLRLAEKWKIA